MSRFQDDKTMFEKSRDQLRYDIREFEKLCQDLSKFGAEQVLSLRRDMSLEISEHAEKLEALMFEQGISNSFIKQQKVQVQRMNASLGAIKHSVDKVETRLMDLTRIE